MKKTISLILFFILIMLIPLSAQAAMNLVYDGAVHTYDEKPVCLFVGGEQISTGMPPILFKGTTLVPARTVFEKLEAKVTWVPRTGQVFVQNNTQNIILKMNDQMVEVNGKKQKSEIPAKMINGNIMIPLRFVSENLGLDVEWNSIKRYIKINKKINKEIKKEVNKNSGRVINRETNKEISREISRESSREINKETTIKTVTVNSNAEKTLINVEADGSLDQYNKMELNSPYRIVMDFPNTTINTKQCNVSVDNNNLQRIRASQYQISPNKSRIVLDFVKKTGYSINYSDDKKLLTIALDSDNSNDTSIKPDKEPIIDYEYKNIRYKNDNGKASITINADVSSEISSKDNEENKSTIFNIPKGLVELEEADMQINDDIISSLQIKSDSSEGYVLTVNYSYNSGVVYETANDGSNNTVINIYKKNEIKVPAGNFLIAIDAGHGGGDPGATYNKEVLEKDLNLDIAIKLNNMLKGAGVNTIMTRDKDVFIALNDRVRIANNANADLFVSIHNNWINTPSCSGTMTLYYPSTDNTDRIASKRFADIAQEEMLNMLGSVNRKTIPRPGLVVLNSTYMPAILAEVGFISNEAERNKLITAEYREKAAKALCNSVIRALMEMNNNEE